MRLPYQTLVDRSLDHQVIFFCIGTRVYISCNCRISADSSLNIVQAQPMGESNDLETAREFYNNPVNHAKDFTEEDKAKW